MFCIQISTERHALHTKNDGGWNYIQTDPLNTNYLIVIVLYSRPIYTVHFMQSVACKTSHTYAGVVKNFEYLKKNGVRLSEPHAREFVLQIFYMFRS